MKQIPNFPGYYAKKDGTIWSAWRKNKLHKLSFELNSKGYYRVKLGRGKKHFVHHLILETFLGPCPEGMEARHYPSNIRTDNRLTNLCYGTREDNMADKLLCGTDNRGENHPLAKITKEDVLEIRRLDKETNMSRKQIADLYNLHPQYVSSLLRKVTWNWC